MIVYIMYRLLFMKKVIYSETPVNLTPSISKSPLYRTWNVVPNLLFPI